MKVLIDYSAGVNQGAGIGRYARGIVPELIAAWPEPEFELWYAPDGQRPPERLSDALARFEQSDRITVQPFFLSRRRADQLFFRARIPLPFRFGIRNPDLVYSPDFTTPPIGRGPRVVTIHDLAFDIVPERAPAPLRNYLREVVPRQARESAAIVAVSETTKRDIIDRLGVPEGKITVAPNAVDPRYYDARPLDDAQRSTLGLPERFLLTVGTLEPRKNHLTLFRAIDAGWSESSLPLVVAGGIGWQADEIVAAARDLAVRGRAILLDYVPEKLLPGLYASAAALIYPSWYEGFGLPVLEGLAVGIPVIASDVPAHREIGGDQVTFIDPGSVEDIAVALQNHGSCDSFVQRELRQAQARRYAWSSSAAILRDVLQEVLRS